jgi:hypothetical protein
LQLLALNFQDLSFSRTSDTLVIHTGQANSVSIQDFYVDAAHQIDRIEYNNGVGIVDHTTGNIAFTSVDTANIAEWRSWYQVRNQQLDIIQEQIVADAGTTNATEYDLTNATIWQSWQSGYDDSGALDWLVVKNHNGTEDHLELRSKQY